MKIKAKEKNGVVSAKLVIKHNMETGRRKDPQGKLVPAHHVTELTATYKGDVVLNVEVGSSVSKDPFLAFSFKGKAGEKVKASWIDNQGKTKSAEATIK